MAIITAHSGCEGTETDSMESIDIALELGADAVEVDVRVDHEGILRISHNSVSQQEFLGKPTFREVLERVVPTGLMINCDIKEQKALYRTLDEAARAGLGKDRLILSGCTGPEQLARDRELKEQAKIFLNAEEVIKFIYFRQEIDFDMSRFSELMNDPWILIREKGEEYQADYAAETAGLFRQLAPDAANISKTLLGTPLFDALRDSGIPFSVWTVKEPEIVRQCLDLDVLNITTRDVRQALDIRKGHLRSS